MLIGYENQPRYSELVERVFGDVGIVPPGSLLELDPFEWWLWKRKRAWQLVRTVAAGGVGFSSALQIFSRAAGRDFVLVERAQIKVISAAEHLLKVDSAPLATGPFAVEARDRRATRPGVQIFTKLGDATAPGSDVWHTLTLANTWVTVISEYDGAASKPIGLGPGTGVNFINPTLNEAIVVQASGYAIPLRDEEVAPE